MPHFFTDTSDGNLASHVGDDPERVAANRRRLAQRLGIEPAALHFMNQVHGNDVVIAGEKTLTADGLITDQPGHALVVLVADCIPLLLHASEEKLIAAVHVGRRGLVNGVALGAIERLRQWGASQITAHVGPAICGSCYEVPPAMQEQVCAVAPLARSTTRSGTTGLDIRSGLIALLQEEGLALQIDPRCTLESDELFSYRRDPHCGRFAGVIMVS